VLIEAFVLGGKNCLLHGVWHLTDRNQVAPLFAKLAYQVAVGSKYAQGDLGSVIRE
jgi:hypothetical protein